MDHPEAKQRLIKQIEEAGKQCHDQRRVMHRALARMNRLDPEQPGVAAIRSHIPTLLHFLTVKHPPDTNPFQKRRLEVLTKGALLYFLDISDAIPDDEGEQGLLDDAWVIQYVAQEISSLLPNGSPFQGDQLSPSACKEAEKQLMELAGAPCMDPESLIREVREKMETVGKIKNHPFTLSMLKQAEELTTFLIHHTSQTGYNPNDYCYRIAIGALRYLIKDNDLINDTIGPQGYLDDAFVLKTAWELFKKNSTG